MDKLGPMTAAYAFLQSLLGEKTYRSTNLQMIFAHRRTIVHSIERSNLVDTHRRHLQQPSNLIHDAQTSESMLTLSEIQNRHNSSLFVLRWISLENLSDQLLVLCCEFERDRGIVFGRVSVLCTVRSFVSTLVDMDDVPLGGRHLRLLVLRLWRGIAVAKLVPLVERST